MKPAERFGIVHRRFYPAVARSLCALLLTSLLTAALGLYLSMRAFVLAVKRIWSFLDHFKMMLLAQGARLDRSMSTAFRLASNVRAFVTKTPKEFAICALL